MKSSPERSRATRGCSTGPMASSASRVLRKPWLADPGWNAGSAKTLDLQMQRSMIIDGEIFRPVDGRVRVTADPVVDFVAP